MLSAACLAIVYATNAQSPETTPASKRIQDAVTTSVEEAEIPGMIAAIISEDGIIAIGAAGARKKGFREEFTTDDVIHIGSCTKAMTSVLIATLVEEELMTWDTTILDVFPELKNRIHSDYHPITVWELLTHRSGIPRSASNWWAYDGMNIEKQRIALIKDTLKDASTCSRGEYQYSNFGYMVAGCMAEKVTDESWESLMQDRIFDPLEMTSAGFGPPGKPGRRDQPWGHTKNGQKWKPEQADNARALGPAGTVHCTIEDWAKFLAIMLPGGNHLSLSPPLLEKLITPSGTYAAGWIIGKRSWAKGKVLTHDGSNTMWYATVWIAPNLNRAFITVLNSYDAKSQSISNAMIEELIKIDQ